VGSVVHLPLDMYDLPSYPEYRGITSCGKTVAAEAMKGDRVTCPGCRGEATPKILAKRAKELRKYLRKMKPQRPLNTAELEVLGLEPSDQDVKVEGKWTQRTLNELLKCSEEKYREPNHD